MNTLKIKQNDEGKRRKRKNEGINKRQDTLIKKAYELGEFDSIDIALIICKHSRYTIYRSSGYTSWPPFMAKIVSKAIAY
jgi:putative salt-induced outer membrane protein YdiY